MSGVKLRVSKNYYHVIQGETSELRIAKSNAQLSWHSIQEGGKLVDGASLEGLEKLGAIMNIECIFKWISLKTGVHLIVVSEIEKQPVIRLPTTKNIEFENGTTVDNAATGSTTSDTSTGVTIGTSKTSTASSSVSTSSFVSQYGSDRNLYKVKKFTIISPTTRIQKGMAVNDALLDRDEIEYLKLLSNTLKDGGQFYYGTPEWDISKRFFGIPTSERADTEHFSWNYEITSKLENPAIAPAFIRGFANTYETGVEHLSLSIVSRICNKLAGTRYNTRGASHSGYAANSVETEQILINNNTGRVYSFLQIRGSIPIAWTQFPTLKYDPPIIIDEVKSNEVYNAYMESQLRRYNKVVCISLVNVKGFEKPLADWFAKVVANHSSDVVQFVQFDFHKECRGMKYENIDNVLWPQIESNVDSFNYHVRELNSMEILQKQTGITRVNCKDSLDRTNVVLSVIGRKIMEKWLRLEENNTILGESDPLSSAGQLWSAFRMAWADNGDAVSTLYAGTGALKADFTRTGKRTYFGIWKDFSNSVMRYYLNNFTDGEKQDGINLLTGAYVVKKDESPFNSVYRGRLIQTLLKFTLVSALVYLLPRKST